MANVAIEKSIEESIYNPLEATNGNITSYDGNYGYSRFNWPGFLTVDLGDIYTIYFIRILLWDGLGIAGSHRDNRIYKYRLLTSSDHKLWDVLLDTGQDGSNGWQVINLPTGLKLRYIRIHGLFNSANEGFHVVQVEAHDIEPPVLNAEIMYEKNISSQNEITREQGDALPLSMRFRGLIKNIEDLIMSYNVLNPEPFKNLISQLLEQVKDVISIEKSMSSIRREIVSPVKDDINKLGKVGNYSFYVGIIGGIVGIISMLLTIWTIFRPHKFP